MPVRTLPNSVPWAALGRLNKNYAPATWPVCARRWHTAHYDGASSCEPLGSGPEVPLPRSHGMPGFALFIGDHLARSVRGRPGAPPR